MSFCDKIEDNTIYPELKSLFFFLSGTCISALCYLIMCIGLATFAAGIFYNNGIVLAISIFFIVFSFTLVCYCCACGIEMSRRYQKYIEAKYSSD